MDGMLTTVVKVAKHMVRNHHLEQSLECSMTSMFAPAEESQGQTALR